MVINDKLIVDQPDGSDRELPWSLETYVQITKKTYVTQPKFIVFWAPAIGMCWSLCIATLITLYT